MSCERSREALALRLYDELDRDEARDLERHLVGCPACARFAGELEEGLGVLARESVSSEPAPRASRRFQRAGARILATAAASFAVGALAAWLVLSGDAAPRAGVAEDVVTGALAGVDGGADPAATSAFRLDAPPPRATGGGQLAVFASYRPR